MFKKFIRLTLVLSSLFLAYSSLPAIGQCILEAEASSGQSSWQQPLNPASYPDKMLLDEIHFLKINSSAPIDNVVWVNERNAYAQKGFGIKLGKPLWNAYAQANGAQTAENAFRYIIFHEYSHLIQFANYSDVERASFPIEYTELQADMLAGVFYARRMGDADFQPYVDGANTAFSIGDTDFSSSQHHGTPKQRMAALITGIEAGRAVNKGAYPNGWAEGHYGPFSPRAFLNWSMNEVRKILTRLDNSHDDSTDDLSSRQTAVLKRYADEASKNFAGIRGKEISSDEDDGTIYESTLPFPGAVKTVITFNVLYSVDVTAYDGKDFDAADKEYQSLLHVIDLAFPDYSLIQTTPSRIALKKHHVHSKGKGVVVSLQKYSSSYQVSLRVISDK